MQCPICNNAAMVEDIRDMPYLYKGELTTLTQVSGEFCSACGEHVLDA